MLTPFKRGILWRRILFMLVCGLALSSYCFGQARQTTCTDNKGKPCPEWLHKLIGQYPPLREQVEEARNARFFTLGDGRARLRPDRTSWIVFVGAHAGAWAATVAAVRNPRSQENPDEYGAVAGITALDTIFFLTACPAIGTAPAGYMIYHYTEAARK